MTVQATFDPISFKETTRAQWQDAAPAWHGWGPVIADWLGESTELMLDLAGVTEGSTVLDVAAGAGEQSLRAARRVGPSGRVVASDIAPNLLELAARDARDAGLTLDTLELDGEALDTLPAGSYDAVISRVGLIYFPDQARALSGARQVLRPGGRFATVTYSTPDRNEFFSIPIGIIRRRAQLPPPLPGQPGPFSLGAPGVLAAVLESAGFRDVAVHTVPSPVRVSTAAECVRFERESFGALHQMMRNLSEAEKAETWAEIEQALAVFEGPDGFVGPCEMLVGVGTAW